MTWEGFAHARPSNARVLCGRHQRHPERRPPPSLPSARLQQLFCPDARSLARSLARSFARLLDSSWSNKLIGAKDGAAVQINIGSLDENGIYTGKFTTFAISGAVRSRVSSRSLQTRTAYLPGGERRLCVLAFR